MRGGGTTLIIALSLYICCKRAESRQQMILTKREGGRPSNDCIKAEKTVVKIA